MSRSLKNIATSLVVVFALSISSICAAKGDMQIVTTSLPFYNLVYSITKGISKPKSIISDSSCPHSYSLKPSDAKAIKNAKIVIWGGATLEPFMEKPISQLSSDTVIIDLSKLDGMKLLPARTPHCHHHHDHGDSKHSHKHHDHGHDHHHKHDHKELYDSHYWLSPENAKVMLNGIAKAISDHKPEYSSIIQSNLQMSTANIDYAVNFIGEKLKKRKIEPFLSFHDAFQYFETSFSIPYWGTVTLDPNSPPTAKHMKKINGIIVEKNIMCIYSEPGFSSKIINNLKDKYPRIEYLTLDPIGDKKDAGENGYIILLESLAKSYLECSTKSYKAK